MALKHSSRLAGFTIFGTSLIWIAATLVMLSGTEEPAAQVCPEIPAPVCRGCEPSLEVLCDTFCEAYDGTRLGRVADTCFCTHNTRGYDFNTSLGKLRAAWRTQDGNGR